MKVDPNNGSEFALPLPQDEEELGTIRSAPMTVVVELARFRTTLDKLMKMAPGNLIELPIRPEQRANLTVNGQVIARVEIVHLGEALGIRVLEKG